MRQFRLTCFQKIDFEMFGQPVPRKGKASSQTKKPEHGLFSFDQLFIYATLNQRFDRDEFLKDLFDSEMTERDFRKYINVVKDYVGEDNEGQSVFIDQTYEFHSAFCAYSDTSIFREKLDYFASERVAAAKFKLAKDLLVLHGTGLASEDIKNLHESQGNNLRWRRWLQTHRTRCREMLLRAVVTLLETYRETNTDEFWSLLETCFENNLFQHDHLGLSKNEEALRDLCHKGLAHWHTGILSWLEALLQEGRYEAAVRLVNRHAIPFTYDTSPRDQDREADKWQQKLLDRWCQVFAQRDSVTQDDFHTTHLMEATLALPSALSEVASRNENWKDWKQKASQRWQKAARASAREFEAQGQLQQAADVLLRLTNERLEFPDHRSLVFLFARLAQPEQMYQHYVRGRDRVEGSGERRQLEMDYKQQASKLGLVLDRRSREKIDLLSAVSTMWIQGKLASHLNDENRLSVEWQSKTSPSRSSNLNDLYASFEQQRRLFIYGEAGTGKTILMLGLLKEVLARAWIRDTMRMPLLIPLNSWAIRERGTGADDFAEWLIEEMKRLYGISREAANGFLKVGFLLFADGLDEFVYEADRLNCATALTAFLQDERYRVMQCVVCCRTPTYQKLRDNILTLRNAFSPQSFICVHPLENHVVETVLQGHPLASVYATNTSLQNLIQTPLYLNMAHFTYMQAEKGTLNQLDRATDIKHHIVDRYFDERIVQYHNTHIDVGNKTIPGQSETMRYTRWLASHLRHENFAVKAYSPFQDWVKERSTHLAAILGMNRVREVYSRYALIHGYQTGLFYLEDLQPQWLGDEGLNVFVERINHLSMLIFGALWGVCGFGAGVIINQIVWQRSDWLLLSLGFGLIVWLAIALTWRFSGGTHINMRIEPVEILRWDAARALDHWRSTLTMSAVAFLVPIVLGLLWSGLLAGVIVSVFFVFMTGLQPHEMRQTLRPNQKMDDTLRNFLFALILQIVFLVSIFGLIVVTINSLKGDVVAGVTLVLVLAFTVLAGMTLGTNTKVMRNGSLCLLQHLLLRKMLHRRGHAPQHYVSFLNYLVEIRVLDRIGGAYQFVHDDILLHFAQEQETEGYSSE